MSTDYEKAYEEITENLRAAKTPEQFRAVSARGHSLIDAAFEAGLSQSEMTVACCEGCHYCCHIKVDVQPKDIFLIADFIRRRFTPAQQEEILKKARANWAKIEPMTLEQHWEAGLTCPLLKDGKCSVYSIRPDSCREAHALRSEPCKRLFENPNASEDLELIAAVKQATSFTHLGISIAFEEEGNDSRPYDINAALIQAIENPASERRWRDGKAAFPKNMLAKDWPSEMKTIDVLRQKLTETP